MLSYTTGFSSIVGLIHYYPVLVGLSGGPLVLKVFSVVLCDSPRFRSLSQNQFGSKT